MQLLAQDHWVKHYKDLHTWAMLPNADEFIVLKKVRPGGALVGMMDGLLGASGVCLPCWRIVYTGLVRWQVSLRQQLSITRAGGHHAVV
jgi:hypothetical protein